MTFQNLQRPHEAAQNLVPAGTMSTEAAPTLLTTPPPGPSGEVIRHVLIGSPEGVRATIHRLYQCHYAEVRQWTGPISIGPEGIHIARNQGQILYYLMRLRSFDLPPG